MLPWRQTNSKLLRGKFTLYLRSPDRWTRLTHSSWIVCWLWQSSVFHLWVWADIEQLQILEENESSHLFINYNNGNKSLVLVTRHIHKILLTQPPLAPLGLLISLKCWSVNMWQQWGSVDSQANCLKHFLTSRQEVKESCLCSHLSPLSSVYLCLLFIVNIDILFAHLDYIESINPDHILVML